MLNYSNAYEYLMNLKQPIQVEQKAVDKSLEESAYNYQQISLGDNPFDLQASINRLKNSIRASTSTSKQGLFQITVKTDHINEEMIQFLQLIGVCLADTFLYETGSIQLSENVKNEVIDLNVKFKKQFNHQPKIAYGFKQIDMEGRILDTEILNLTPNGFTLRLTTDNLDKISINWLATDNPIIHVEYVKSSQETFKLPLIDELKDSNNVNSFIVGFEFEEGQKKHLSQTVTQKENTIEVQSDKVAYYKLCLILTNFDNVYAKNTMGLEANENHPWKNL
ncbi:hypothetical protein pb186bvf_015052 [Paramecium bursaria]